MNAHSCDADESGDLEVRDLEVRGAANILSQNGFHHVILGIQLGLNC